MIASAYPSLERFFADLYRPRRLLGCAAGTIRQYHLVLASFARFLGRTPEVSDLDEDIISEYLAWMATGHARATVWNHRKMLMALATYAQKKGLLASVPDVARIRLPRSIPTSYTVSEIAQLLEAARSQTGFIDGIPAGSYWFAFFLTAYDTGARASALWALQWSDWREPFFLFRAETQKQRADQMLRVAPDTARALAAIRRGTGLVFPWPLKRRAKYNRIRRIFRDAGLPHGRKDLLQRIRRTTATLMHQAGGDATAQLGHSSDTITRMFYLASQDATQACDLLPRPSVPVADRQRRLF